jgi:hypothetical protein
LEEKAADLREEIWVIGFYWLRGFRDWRERLSIVSRSRGVAMLGDGRSGLPFELHPCESLFRS